MLITDGEVSYAVFVYRCGAINWSGGAVVGYRGSGGNNDTRIHPASFSDAVLLLGCNDLDTYPWENLIYQLPLQGGSNDRSSSYVSTVRNPCDTCTLHINCHVSYPYLSGSAYSYTDIPNSYKHTISELHRR